MARSRKTKAVSRRKKSRSKIDQDLNDQDLDLKIIGEKDLANRVVAKETLESVK